MPPYVSFKIPQVGFIRNKRMGRISFFILDVIEEGLKCRAVLYRHNAPVKLRHIGKKIAAPTGTAISILFLTKPINLTFDLAAGNLLLVDCFQHLSPAFYRRLGETLALTQ